MSSQSKCWSCGHLVDLQSPVSFRLSCPQCSADLHACKQCIHFSPSSYNACNEPRAERVLEKEKFNYCEEYTPHLALLSADSSDVSPQEMARLALEALFKK